MFPVFNIDVYWDEFEQFQWDVHILIEGTLFASIQYLDKRAKERLSEIQSSLDKATADEHQQYLVDEHVDVLATNDGQERFVFAQYGASGAGVASDPLAPKNGAIC
jgi:hypothetical protein